MADLLVIQRGHYPRTKGATGTAGVDSDPTEQEFAVVAAKALATLAARRGWQTRVINADEAKARYKGDAFVAIHCDGSTNRAAHGASVGYRTPEGAAFGQAWKRAYAALGWRGFRPDNYTNALARYYGTGYAVAVGNRQAIIAETGFLTNPADEQVLQSRGADMFAAAVMAALGAGVQPLRPPVPPVLGAAPVLRLGSGGDSVRQWQSILAGAGLLAEDDIDGVFGPLTEHATKRFQTQLGLKADGVVGPKTREATARLLAWLSAQAKYEAKPPAFPGTIRPGSRGWAVKVWQRQLQTHGYRVGGGIYDAATGRAVRDWQRNHHPPLEVDGVAGPATWHSLLKA
jgi:peptidoglycan hydrolase-like protein with peptidoglycan-binding domain